MDQKEAQQRVLRYQQLQNRMEMLTSRRELLINRLIEIESTLEALENIDTSKEKEILLPLGSGVYISGRLSGDNKIVMTIGEDAAIDTTLNDARKTVDEYKNETAATIQVFEDEILKYKEELTRMEPEIRSIIEKR